MSGNFSKQTPLNLLQKSTEDNWLIGYNSQKFLALTEALFAEFAAPFSQKIIIAESDTFRFLAAFIAACSRGDRVFLGNPGWGAIEWEQVLEIVKPDLVLGNYFNLAKDGTYKSSEFVWQDLIFCFAQRRKGAKKIKEESLSQIMIPTGGSSGKIRFVTHDWQTLSASVDGFCQYFQLSKVNSFCVLPLFHVSGLMQFMRSFVSGGKLSIASFAEVKAGNWLDFDPSEFFISLVPTQLQFLLDNYALKNWLSGFKTVLLGGAPSWDDLLNKARETKIPIAPCYGMTETASQIATLKPEMFLTGDRSSGQILPHAKVRILDPQGQQLQANQIGRIAIEAKSLALGYYPEYFTDREIFYTDDAGFFDAKGNLNLVGRLSDKIITGGENVFPNEVESVIRSTNLVVDVCVIGSIDRYWGQIITAVYVPQNSSISSQDIHKAIEGKIAKFKHPKLWISVEVIPRNDRGKIDRSAIDQIAKDKNNS
jgi:O-succinylbenzoic acid--CoA ligase